MTASPNPDEISAAASARTVVADAAALANDIVARAATKAADVIALAVASAATSAATSPTLTLVADQAATRAVEQVFLRLGVDLSDKAAVYTTKEAFGWLIRFKRRIEGIYRALLPAVASAGVAGAVGLIAYHYK